MTRLRKITIAAAVLLVAVLGVLAYLLGHAQSEDRRDVRDRFADVARIATSVTNGIFQASLQAGQQQAATRLGSPHVTDAAVEEIARPARLLYAAVLDPRGRPLAATRGAPRKFGDATKTALKTSKARLSDVMDLGSKQVIEWAIPYPTQSGQRILVEGIPTPAFADFLTQALKDVANFAEPETVMLDGHGVVLGGVRLSADVGQRVPDDQLIEAVADSDRGSYGDGRYFASGGIEGSPFRIVLDTTEDKLYEDVDTAVPWIIFVAFALTGLLGLVLLQRALASAAELQRRSLNEKHAVEINDNIIQGLALAKYQLQRGEGEASATQVSDTLREAQRLVSGLLGEAEVQAGQLRREVAAETTRPEGSES